ncbi:MAG: hypothetical protein KDK34_01805, partial [Leptospiraceae bacterium]|nr:hypothetical protein [Leptospiraceae bacterium]
ICRFESILFLPVYPAVLLIQCGFRYQRVNSDLGHYAQSGLPEHMMGCRNLHRLNHYKKMRGTGHV